MTTCVDICHFFTCPQYNQYNHIGDCFIGFQVMLFFISLYYADASLVYRFAGLFMAIMIFREVVSLVTRCPSCVNTSNRPFLGGDDRWYVISGHLFTSIIMTYITWRSHVNGLLKIMMGLLTSIIFFVQIITREHYTKDMLITALIGFLLIKAYGS